MLNLTCHWLPELILYSDYNDWFKYEDFIYGVFRKDFIDSRPNYIKHPVRIRYHPMVCGKEQAFFHITSTDLTKDCIDPNDRIPDFRRCERVGWPRKIIENHDCADVCLGCSKVKIWKKPYKMYHRVHLLMEDFKYMLVLEERESYYLLVTAFYLEYEHTIRKKLQEFEKYKE